MRYTMDEVRCRNLEVSANREWMLANGIGGFAMGTVSGINTRRYHGLLVAATDPPAVRHVLLASVDAFVQTDGIPIGLSCNQYPGAVFPEGFHYLRSFALGRNAVWRYRAGSVEIEKRLMVHPGRNAVTLVYENFGEKPFLLTLRPLVSHKFYHANFTEREGYPNSLLFPKNQTLVEHDGIALAMAHPGAQRVPVQGWYYRFEHPRETDRGLDPRDDLFCPCELRWELLPGEKATLVAWQGGEEPQPLDEGDDSETTASLGAALRQAADKFFVESEDRATIIAGYPWFTDWGRDTMIALPGILLCTGRVAQARKMLRDFARFRSQGLIPNRFTESGGTDTNTVDATLWFVHAVYKTLEAEWDAAFAEEMREAIADILDWHRRGTLFGIRMDPADGLLAQGEPGLQLTWMDAKIGDWVVTPRHGKPVEINGLWINAVRIAAFLEERLGGDAAPLRELAERAEESFRRKFWHEVRGHYLDTVDPDDASLRPNQLIAMALPFGPATGPEALRALDKVTHELLTPVGLRTLGPNEPGYRPKFRGPLTELDASYHQGTVWPWLLGPYVSALVRLTGDRKEAKRILRNAKEMLTDCGLGGIAEVYDAEAPHEPGGCPWQAWSVAEILRAWVEDANGT